MASSIMLFLSRVFEYQMTGKSYLDILRSAIGNVTRPAFSEFALARAGCARCERARARYERTTASESTRIFVLIEADEGVHLALEDEPAFEALPHPLAPKPISDAAQAALAPHGVAPGATTFDAAEALRACIRCSGTSFLLS